jgi:hypothetical protein
MPSRTASISSSSRILPYVSSIELRPSPVSFRSSVIIFS